MKYAEMESHGYNCISFSISLSLPPSLYTRPSVSLSIYLPRFVGIPLACPFKLYVCPFEFVSALPHPLSASFIVSISPLCPFAFFILLRFSISMRARIVYVVNRQITLPRKSMLFQRFSLGDCYSHRTIFVSAASHSKDI